MPAASATFEPAIHVHWPVTGLYSHRSLYSWARPVVLKPRPPNNQTLPLASSHTLPLARAAGTLPAAAVPWVPYTPAELGVLGPPTQVHKPVRGLKLHRSLNTAR